MAKRYLSAIDLVKNELQNARVQNLASAPAAPVQGQIYYDTTVNSLMVWDASAWRTYDPLRITDGTLPIAKLDTNPLARANHTGTQLASTISDLASTVQAYRLDQFAAPTASVSANNQRITNLGAPTAGSNDAVRMVDLENAVNGAAAGIDSKPSVRVVAVANVTLSGLQTIDGVTLVNNDRVLLTAQTTASQNGVYVASSGAWTRATDADATGEITPGAFWFVEEGTTYSRTQWRCNNQGAITLGSTNITIIQFGASSSYTNGNGLSLIGNVFAVVAGTGITVGANVAIDTTVVARKFAQTIGDGSATQYTVTHNFNNQDVIVSVREIATNDKVEVDIRNNGVNTVLITFASAPASNAYRVTVIG